MASILRIDEEEITVERLNQVLESIRLQLEELEERIKKLEDS